MNPHNSSRYKRLMVRRLYRGVMVALTIALAWWKMSKNHGPRWCAVTVVMIWSGAYLGMLFLWAGFRWLMPRMVHRASQKLTGWIHLEPEIHRSEWSDEVEWRHIGPFREYVLFGPVYYATGEGRKCRKCNAFKVDRKIRVW